MDSAIIYVKGDTAEIDVSQEREWEVARCCTEREGRGSWKGYGTGQKRGITGDKNDMCGDGSFCVQI